MMRTLSSISQNLLRKVPVRAFSSTHGHHAQHVEDTVIVTKHNPLAEKDLRGFEHLGKLNENQKSYSPIHTTVEDSSALYSIFSWLPNKFAKSLGRIAGHPKSALASDSLHLPKITENGVSLYDSIKIPTTYISINKVWTNITPLFIIGLAYQPGFSLLTYGILSYVYFSTNWKVVNNLVVRAELSPQTEEIVYQKINAFGRIDIFRVKISDLEATTLLQIYGENNPSEKSIRGLLNRDVAFRIKSTKELLLFDKHGIWNEEGVNHPLLL